MRRLTHVLTHLLIAAMWCLHWLPYSWQIRIGRGVALLLYPFVTPRRRIVMRNLELCFPGLSAHERELLCQEHLRLWVRTFLDRGLLWFGSRERLTRLIKVEGLEHFQAAMPEKTGRPWMILTPHFVGLDAGGIVLLLQRQGISLYVQTPNKVLNRRLHTGRLRFFGGELYPRSAGIRPVIKAMKRGLPFFVLPDMDLGRVDSVFANFFGVPTATVTVLPRLARMTRAVVVPLVVSVNQDDSGYTARFYPPWMDYPGKMSDDEGAQYMNTFIENRVRDMPAQYYWVHRRFKTRPEGETPIY